jgi:hypothetical protein
MFRHWALSTWLIERHQWLQNLPDPTSALGFRLTSEPTPVQEFALERGEEALRHRVVVRIAKGASASGQNRARR